MPKTYNISYAYPTSQLATRAGYAKTGCYALTDGNGKIKGFVNKANVLQAAKETGLEPNRWSLDHPLNLHLDADTRQELARLASFPV